MTKQHKAAVELAQTSLWLFGLVFHLLVRREFRNSWQTWKLPDSLKGLCVTICDN